MTATSSASPAPAAGAAPSKNVFRLHGVNVLNRKNVDSISRLTALEKRRATHILDERQRRDTMNQLLGELANLVRESAAEAQQQHQQHQDREQKQYNADGSEKKAPVKSNSITTLRNAITEIRRLRSYAGLETVTAPCAASLAVVSPNASRSSSPVETSPAPVSHKHQQYLQQPLPALAPMAQYSSRHSTPMSSPKSYPSQMPMAPHHHHQLQSPPLSPSSPAPQQYSSVSPPMAPIHHSNQTPSLPSLFAAPTQQSQPQQHGHYYSQQAQQHHQPAQHYHQSQQQGHYQAQPQQQYSPRYESYSRPTSPSAPTPSSMMLPQSYMQHPSTYQSSSY